MNRRRVLLLAAPVILASAQNLAPPKFEPKLLIADFRIARAALEEGHSGIYRCTPKTALDRAFDDAERLLDHAMSPLDFYRVLAPAVANIKCGHTAVLPPRDVQRVMDSAVPLFPFDVEVLDGKVYVFHEYQAGDRRFAGFELRRINGVPIESILRTMIAATPGDGDSRTVRPWQIGHGGHGLPIHRIAQLDIERTPRCQAWPPAAGSTH